MPTKAQKPYTFTVLKRGQRVTTPLGPGTITDIEVQLGVYKDGTLIEMDPPTVTVKLSETGQEEVICMCKLDLEDEGHQAIVRSEFSRL